MSGRDELGSVTIGAREIYDVLVRVERDMSLLQQRDTDVRETLAKHEQRLSEIDRWRFGMPVAALTGVASLVITLLKTTGAV